MQVRKAIAPEDITDAVAIDEAVVGSKDRADYIARVAQNGGLSVAGPPGDVRAFCCLDHAYFFERPFVSLLVVSPDAQRLGLGTSLLVCQASAYPELWTSTNQSNAAMRKLLDKLGWRYCGEVSGLDEGDPELFYRSA